jgi:hypothetical protein
MAALDVAAAAFQSCPTCVMLKVVPFSLWEKVARRTCEGIGIKRYSPPCITARRGGRATKKYREASADREAGVVFQWKQKENHPGCVCFGGCAKFS